MTIMTKLKGRKARPFTGYLLAGMMALPLAGCDTDELLSIVDPDVLPPELLGDESALPSFLAAAQGEFSIGYEDQILYSGLLGDEWISSGTFPTRVEVDIRQIQPTNGTLEGVTRNLYQARTAAEEAVRAYEGFDVTGSGYAEANNLAALTYVLFGENYCSGVPFSRMNPDFTFEYGGQETTTQIFNRALTTTDRVLDLGEDDVGETQTHLANLVRARTLLNLGQYADAAAAVEDVPTDFIYFIAHSQNTSRENNRIYSFNTIQERWSAADVEGENGLPYRTIFTDGDPRTPWRRSPANDVGFDRRTAQYDTRKYHSRASRTPVATGVEARLIEAEARLRADDPTYIIILNELRADAVNLMALQITDFRELFPNAQNPGPLVDPVTPKARADQLFAERAYWLYLTSHRLGDMRRLLRQPAYQALGYTEDTVFPTGAYHKSTQGGVYGNDVNLPLTVDERNNPELVGIPTGQDLCLDRNP